ncbi:MAG: GNAT family N-acetyltransferase, partial [Candidatus Omnitrophica bacterium]|nr:GNAT family N-acetyltransferase [Candidatus Omnitrophota bacterium]
HPQEAGQFGLEDATTKPNTYTLPVPESVQKEIAQKYSTNRTLTNIEVTGLDLRYPEQFVDNHYEVLKQRLAQIEQLLGRAPPTIQGQFPAGTAPVLNWSLVITTDLSLTKGMVAACDIATKTVYIHPYFFSISQEDLTKEGLTLEQLQLKILYHELVSHILKGLSDTNGVAMRDTQEWFASRREEKGISIIPSEPTQELLQDNFYLAAIRRAIERLKAIGSFEQLKAMNFFELAEAIGAIEIKDLRYVYLTIDFLFTVGNYQAVEQARVSFMAQHGIEGELTIEKLLATIPNLGYIHPERRNFPEHAFIHPEITGSGIYYHRKNYERAVSIDRGYEYNRVTIIFHELLEDEFRGQDLNDDEVFRKYFVHAHPFVLLAEILFAAVAGPAYLNASLNIIAEQISRARWTLEKHPFKVRIYRDVRDAMRDPLISGRFIGWITSDEVRGLNEGSKLWNRQIDEQIERDPAFRQLYNDAENERQHVLRIVEAFERVFELAKNREEFIKKVTRTLFGGQKAISFDPILLPKAINGSHLDNSGEKGAPLEAGSQNIGPNIHIFDILSMTRGTDEFSDIVTGWLGFIENAIQTLIEEKELRSDELEEALDRSGDLKLLEELVQLENQSHTEVVLKQFKRWLQKLLYFPLEQTTGLAGVYVLVASEDNQSGIIGMAQVEVDDQDGKRIGTLGHIIVSPAMKHRGIGTALLRRAIEIFQDAGVDIIEIPIHRDNQESIDFHAKRLKEILGIDPHIEYELGNPNLILVVDSLKGVSGIYDGCEAFPLIVPEEAHKEYAAKYGEKDLVRVVFGEHYGVYSVDEIEWETEKAKALVARVDLQLLAHCLTSKRAQTDNPPSKFTAIFTLDPNKLKEYQGQEYILAATTYNSIDTSYYHLSFLGMPDIIQQEVFCRHEFSHLSGLDDEEAWQLTFNFYRGNMAELKSYLNFCKELDLKFTKDYHNELLKLHSLYSLWRESFKQKSASVRFGQDEDPVEPEPVLLPADVYGQAVEDVLNILLKRLLRVVEEINSISLDGASQRQKENISTVTDLATKFINEAGILIEFLSGYFEVSRLDMGQIISLASRKVVELAEENWGWKGAIHFAQPVSPVIIKEGVYELIFGAFLELFTNAIKYGATEIWVDIKERFIYGGQPAIAIVIKDNGWGIQPADIEKIFFKREVGYLPGLGDKKGDVVLPNGKSINRTGEGLYMVRRIFRTHDADVYAMSEGINRGSVFTIRMPIEASAKGNFKELLLEKIRHELRNNFIQAIQGRAQMALSEGVHNKDLEISLRVIPFYVKDIVRLLHEIDVKVITKEEDVERQRVSGNALDSQLSPVPTALDSDLRVLSARRGKELAKILREVLEEVQFDLGNGLIRNREANLDYYIEPLPRPAFFKALEEIRETLSKLSIKESESGIFTDRLRPAFRFFMFGESLSIEELEELFGQTRANQIEEFIEASLFVLTSDRKVRMNGLSLSSRQLRNGEVIYIFADTPAYFDAMLAPEKVYIGTDSYFLLERISDVPDISGYFVEIGSGSGIQLIAALKLNQDINKAIGLEIDARAINVSLFNAALNGVEDRIAIVSGEQALARELGGNRVSFAVMNPPFIAMPEFISLDSKYENTFSGITRVIRKDGFIQIDIRDLYGKAGWGGQDGIRITREWMELLLPYMARGSEIVIYSPFSGDAQGPTKITEYIRSKPGLFLRFEQLSLLNRFANSRGSAGSEIPGVVLSEDCAFAATAYLLQRNQAIKLGEKALSAVSNKIMNGISASYEAQGITHFHSGHAIITIGHPDNGSILQGNEALSRLAERLKQGKFEDVTDNESLRRDISAIESRIGSSLSIAANTPLRIIATDAVIVSKDDFVFGFYSHAPPVKTQLIRLLGENEFNRIFPQPTLVLTNQILNHPNPLIRQEYILHEFLCPT